MTRSEKDSMIVGVGVGLFVGMLLATAIAVSVIRMVEPERATVEVVSTVDHFATKIEWCAVTWVRENPRPATPVVGHDHSWSCTLDGRPVSGAECVSCGEVAE